MNNICITGRLCAQPELKETGNGISVCSLSVAVDRDYKTKGEKNTDFIPCVFWRQTAEFVSKYFKKGDMIAVVGSLESRKYKDKNGNCRTVLEVKADKVNFCGGKNGTTKQEQQQTDDFQTVDYFDDIPF